MWAHKDFQKLCSNSFRNEARLIRPPRKFNCVLFSWLMCKMSNVLSPALKGNTDHSSISRNSRNTNSYTQVINQHTAYDDYGLTAVGGNTETIIEAVFILSPLTSPPPGQKLTRLNYPGNHSLLRHGH